MIVKSVADGIAVCYYLFMELKGYLVTNGFTDSSKYAHMYGRLIDAAKARGVELVAVSNIELMSDAALGCTVSGEPLLPFALFWDKDVRLGKIMEHAGVRLFNSALAIELCDDKSLTHIALMGKVAMPKTVLVPLTYPQTGYRDMDFVEKIGEYLGYPFVIKECFGSFGKQVYLAKDIADAKEIILKTTGVPIIAQEFIETSFGRDARLYMVGGKCAAAMLRRNTEGDFRANIAIGASAEPYDPTPEDVSIASAACEALGLDFAGIDILFGKNDSPILCEVNSNAHFDGISAATGVDIPDIIISHIIQKLMHD